jgi:hypothetical protein
MCVLYAHFYLQVSDSAIPHQTISYIRESLGRLVVKIPAVDAHRGADRRDDRTSLRDLFIKIIHSTQDQFIEFEIESLSEQLHQPRLLSSNPARAAQLTHQRLLQLLISTRN